MEPEVKDKFDSYPKHIRARMVSLREVVFRIAGELDLGEVEETLKWGEPTYRVSGGSPLRMDWKEKSPGQYFLFFHCQTKLVDTFRELYPDHLEFEGNRAIVLNVDEEPPKLVIKHCMELALRYHSIKHLPLLGA